MSGGLQTADRCWLSEFCVVRSSIFSVDVCGAWRVAARIRDPRAKKCIFASQATRSVVRRVLRSSSTPAGVKFFDDVPSCSILRRACNTRLSTTLLYHTLHYSTRERRLLNSNKRENWMLYNTAIVILPHGWRRWRCSRWWSHWITEPSACFATHHPRVVVVAIISND